LRLYPQPMASPSSRPSRQLSVIIPTYEEKDNIRPLTERLFKAVKEAGIETELLFMDDESKDTEATEKIVAELQRQGYLVRIHTRRKTEGRGLSSAVLLGFDKARYDTMLCMDADLQHEPESVPAVADPVLRQEAEFSVGSRHVGGGGLGFNWSIHRRLISAIATMLAFPLTSSTDPMSGFFCTSKRVLQRGRHKCNPVGFKIGLEIMVRCRCNPVVDVPITFQNRLAGESKLSPRQNVLYLIQLVSLYWDKCGFEALIALLLVLTLLVVVSVLL